MQVPLKQEQKANLQRNSTKEANSEVSILSKIDHPHIIKYYESFVDQSNLYIIMSYASKGDLHHILKRRKIRKDHYAEQEIWQMSFQLLSALHYLHSNNIIHRDVKTLNVFMDAQGKLHLGDLGVSKILKQDAGLFSRVGTPLYLAPEIIKYQKYDYKADIWGLGCVAYLLTSLNHPFQGKNIISLGQNIVSAEIKIIQNYSENLNKFIHDMLEKNPLKRPSASQLLKKYYSDNISTKNLQPIFSQKNEQVPSFKMIPLQAKNGRVEPSIKNQIKQFNIKCIQQFKSAQWKRRVNNNFMSSNEENFIFNQCDKIKQDDIIKSSKKITEKSLEETIVLTKKITKLEQIKRYAELTYKNKNNSSNIEDKQEAIIINEPSKENSLKVGHHHFHRKANENYSNSDKKFNLITPQSLFLKIDSTKNKMFFDNSTDKFLNQQKIFPESVQLKNISIQNNKIGRNTIEFQNLELIKLPSDNRLSGSSKIHRVRPKSSIMNKQKHESVMRLMKKSNKKIQLSEHQNTIETKYLHKPDIIML